MSVVRVTGQLRLVASTLLHKQKKLPSQQLITRNAGSVIYRGTGAQESKVSFYLSRSISFLMWYWILYHCWYEFDHLWPERSFPDETKFTDEELGIPPDNED